MVLSMDKWVGKVAVVTGASSGIGAAIAKKLVENGIIVAGLARRKERMDELARGLSDQKGKLFPIKCDASMEEEILEAFKWMKENLGPIYILVNNAGIIMSTSLSNGDTQKWKQVFDVNVVALCIATREAIKDMRANEIEGQIIHISSILGHIIFGPSLNVYPATKHAIKALTESLRQELTSQNSKIKISSISPGGVNTNLVTGNDDTNIAGILEGAPLLEAEDIADSVEYILSTPPHVQVHDIILRPVNESL